jgi:hypothetical protein
MLVRLEDGYALGATLWRFTRTSDRWWRDSSAHGSGQSNGARIEGAALDPRGLEP